LTRRRGEKEKIISIGRGRGEKGSILSNFGKKIHSDKRGENFTEEKEK